MEIEIKWNYAKGTVDTKDMELICVPARGRRICGPDEWDADCALRMVSTWQSLTFIRAMWKAPTPYVRKFAAALMSFPKNKSDEKRQNKRPYH